MRIGIVGSRTFTDIALMKGVISVFDELGINLEIVSGGAQGADTLAREVAEWLGAPLIEHLPNTEAYGWPGAAFERNTLIVADVEELFAFFGPGEPPSMNRSGTMDTVRKAVKKRIPVHLYFQP